MKTLQDNKFSNHDIYQTSIPHDGVVCVVCNSNYVVRFLDYPSSKSNSNLEKFVRIYYCMACSSMMSPKCTPLENGGSALIWYKSVSDRNRLWAEKLLSCLNQAGFQPARIIEFGCGIGSFLKVASEHGIKCEGWDIDAESIDYGKSVFGLDLMAEYLDPDKIVASKETILVSISVLEHIQNPRPTLKKIANFINRTGGAAYISVPFVTSAMLRDYSDGNIPCGAPPDVHVTLFSEQGFLKAFSDFGEFSYQKVKGGGWMGYLIRSNS